MKKEIKRLVEASPYKGTMIYVAQPFGGDERQQERAQQTITRLIEQYPDMVFVSPVLQYGHMYESCPYVDGMELCLDLLAKCGALLLMPGWEESRGCMAEWAAASVWGIRTYYGDGDCIIHRIEKGDRLWEKH